VNPDGEAAWSRCLDAGIKWATMLCAFSPATVTTSPIAEESAE
jgi:hypothetical protein